MDIKTATVAFLKETVYELRKSITKRGYVPKYCVGKVVYYDIFKGDKRTGVLTAGVVVRATKTSFTVAPIACGGALNMRRKCTYDLAGTERRKPSDNLVHRIHPVSLVDLGLRPADILQPVP